MHHVHPHRGAAAGSLSPLPLARPLCAPAARLTAPAPPRGTFLLCPANPSRGDRTGLNATRKPLRNPARPPAITAATSLLVLSSASSLTLFECTHPLPRQLGARGTDRPPVSAEAQESAAAPSFRELAPVSLGLGRIVALYHRSSAS